MVLTREQIKATTALAAITDEQLEAIESLIQANEDKAVGNALKRVHDSYDEDIKSVLGLDKGSEKTYDRLKSILTDLKAKADEAGKLDAFKKQVSDLTRDNQELQRQLESGSGDETVKRKLRETETKLQQANQDLQSLQQKFEQEQTTYQQTLKQKEAEAMRMLVERDIQGVLAGKKFNSSIPESVLQETIQGRQNRMLTEYTLSTEEVDGKQVAVLRDKQGEILRNKEKGMKPYTPAEFFETQISDLVAGQRQQPGTGGTPPVPQSGGTATIDLSGVRSKTEAMSLIHRHVATVDKIAKTDPRFGQRVDELVKENTAYKDLPMEVYQ